MNTQERVLKVFENLGVQGDAQIVYHNPDGAPTATTVENFGYIISQADVHGVIYVPLMEAFDDAQRLLVFAGSLLENINQAIIDGTFIPVTAESVELYDMEDWEEE